MIWYLVIPALMAAGAIARRFMGGYFGKHSRGFEIAAVGAVTGVAVAASMPELWAAVVAGLLAAACAAGVASMGDGDGTDVGTYQGEEPDQGSFDFLVGRSDNSLPYTQRRNRDLRQLVASGLMQTLAAGVLVASGGHLFAGVFLGLSGALKAPAYWAAYQVPTTVKGLNTGRELGEAFWGATLGLASGVVLVSIFA